MEETGNGQVVCLFCGFAFAPADTLCQHGCPLRTACGLIRCPNCDYEFPAQAERVSWFRRLFGRERDPAIALCETCQPLTELGRGDTARVVALSGTRHPGALAVFGLVPGSDITLLQRHPAYVVQVGETQLALEDDIARGIFVERAGSL